LSQAVELKLLYVSEPYNFKSVTYVIWNLVLILLIPNVPYQSFQVQTENAHTGVSRELTLAQSLCFLWSDVNASSRIFDWLTDFDLAG
jgi:hypothetical protein